MKCDAHGIEPCPVCSSLRDFVQVERVKHRFSCYAQQVCAVCGKCKSCGFCECAKPREKGGA